MTLDIQFKLKSNPNYIKYIRENSNWYKILTRHPEKFNLFEEEVKDKYHLRVSDRISNTLEMIEMVQNLMSSLK
jgi:hypothetical protein